MAQNFVETSGTAEGGDPLRTWLLKYQQRLKLLNASKFNKVYNKLNDEDIDDEFLLQTTQENLKPILVKVLGAIQAVKIINLLQTIPESTIHKKKDSIKVVAISNEEDNAITNIKKAAQKVENIMNDITINIGKVNENSKKCEQSINDSFNNIINNVNKRRNELLLKLKTITQNKQNRLLLQQNDLKLHKKVLNECYEKSQEIVRDINLDKQTRKNTILTSTNKLLQNEMVDNFKLGISTKIKFKIDIDNINHALKAAGNVLTYEENESKSNTVNPFANDSMSGAKIDPTKKWVVSGTQKASYDIKFYSLTLGAGKASGQQVMSIMLLSRLSKDVLRKIWDLSDIDQDGKMDNEEFALCAYLIDMAKDGVKLPSTLPLALVPPGKRHLVEYE